MFEISEYLDLSHTIAAPLFEGKQYPWEVLPEISEFIKKIGPTLDPEVYEKRGEDIWIAKSAVVFDSSAIVGTHCVVGNSTELKNVILFDNVQVPHYNYVGDSVLGYKSHMGAGSITSNVKSDKTLVHVKYEGGDIATGLKKFAAILGDNVEVGCGSVLNPGTVIGRGSRIYPLSMVRGTVAPKSIYKKAGEIVTIEE